MKHEMNREEQQRNLRLLVAQMLDFLEADITVDRDLPEREELFEYLKRFRIELKDEADHAVYEHAMEEYKKNPVTYSHEEVVRMFEQEKD